MSELPRTLRDSFRNKIITGVWTGHSKPSSDILFENLIENLAEINKFGIRILNQASNASIKVGIYGFAGDGPARSLVLHMVEHMGYYACYYCLIRGTFLSEYFISTLKE